MCTIRFDAVHTHSSISSISCEYISNISAKSKIILKQEWEMFGPNNSSVATIYMRNMELTLEQKLILFSLATILDNEHDNNKENPYNYSWESHYNQEL